ncbi:MAG: CDP-alcohol phosphatidyltransferase family protein [Candidatus Margulisiibacteriota bacterium]|jgi:phosphatidylglycerophosphate synthase
MLNQATKTIPVLWLFYISFIPLTKVLIFFKITPNIITTVSNIFVLIACYFLFIPASPIFFSIFWLLALGFDVCDGMVARKCKLATANGSFYDHTSDQLKLIFLFLTIALKYNDIVIWTIAFLSCSLFLFLGVLNNVANFRELKLENIEAKSHNEKIKEHLQENVVIHKNWFKLILNKMPLLKKIILGVYNSMFILQGNVMIYLAVLSFGRNVVICTLFYFIFVVLLAIKNSIKSNVRVNSRIYELKGSWK